MARIRTVKPETPASRWGPDDIYLPAGATALYRLWDASGQLLYVGITSNPRERWRVHALKKAWWPEVASITYEEFPKEYLALNAERAAIKSERPQYNKRSAVAC